MCAPSLPISGEDKPSSLIFLFQAAFPGLGLLLALFSGICPVRLSLPLNVVPTRETVG